MDPNTALAEIRAEVVAILDGDHDRALALAEWFAGLDDWLSGGGFLPDSWKNDQ